MTIIERCQRMFFKPSSPVSEAEWMRSWLEGIRDFDPKEIVKDAYAYDRLVETYREAARKGLSMSETRDAYARF